MRRGERDRRARVRRGVNFIDTADAYTKGVSETMTGAAIRANRHRWILATKAGNVMTERAARRRAVAALAVPGLRGEPCAPRDRLHRHLLPAQGRPATPIAETIAAIGDLVRAGKIRYFGVSNYRGWRIAEVVRDCEELGVAPPVVCQPYYNLLNRMPEVEILPACDYYGIGVAPYSPVARGVLTGKYAAGAAPEGSRGGRKDARFMETEFREESFAIAQKLEGACAEDRAHADPARAGVAVGKPHRLVGDRRPAHARAVAGLHRRDRHAVVARTTRSSSIRSSRRAIRRRPATTIRSIRSSGGDDLAIYRSTLGST